MTSYTPGQPVLAVIALEDESGAALTPTALRRRILDEEETVLLDWDVVDIPAAGAGASVLVAGALNLLTPPAMRGARTVELEVTTATQVLVLTQTYLLAAAAGLSGVNSYQTYAQALVAAAGFTDQSLAGWSAVTDRASRVQALIEAHSRIQLLPIVIEYDDSQSIVRDIGEDPWRLRDLTPAQIANLDARLLDALRMAQLVEADEILADDPVKRARREGLISASVGESSQFFGTSKMLDLGVGQRAMKYLSRWIRFRATLGRS